MDVDLSPDTQEPWLHSYQTLLSWALLPAEDEVGEGMKELGSNPAKRSRRQGAQRLGKPPKLPLVAALVHCATH